MNDPFAFFDEEDGGADDGVEIIADEGIIVPRPRNPVALPEWDKRLVVDVCLAVGEDAILEAHSLTAWQLDALYNDTVFMAAVARLKEELKKDGMSFKLKCQLQAEAMLDENWKLAHDPETPASVREKIIANTVRWASYDTPTPALGGGNGFTIAIHLGNSRPTGATLEHEPD